MLMLGKLYKNFYQSPSEQRAKKQSLLLSRFNQIRTSLFNLSNETLIAIILEVMVLERKLLIDFGLIQMCLNLLFFIIKHHWTNLKGQSF